MQELIDSYLKWLKDGLHVRKLENSWHQIVTPFVNHQNDLISLYIKREKDNSITVSDGGEALNELSLSGVDINKSKGRQNEFKTIVQSFGLTYNGDESLSIKTTDKLFPQVKHRMIQALISIDDLFVLSSEKVKNFFIEDIALYFDLNEVPYVQDNFFMGKSGFSHKLDFVLPKNQKINRPEIAVKAINFPRKDTISSAIFMIRDIKEMRRNTNGLFILNDEKGIDSDVTAALMEYNLPFVNWSTREKGFKELDIVA